MDSRAKDAFKQMIETVLKEHFGIIEIDRAKSLLYNDLNKDRFNSARADEVFQMAIERAICNKLGSLGAITVTSIRKDGIIQEFAKNETEEFKKFTHAEDQRPPRHGILAKILGR